MKLFSRLFLRGLAAVLPLALTGYLVWLAVSSVENLLRGLLKALFPDVVYWPGMGFAASILTAASTVFSVVVAIPVGQAFNGTQVPLMTGVLVFSGLAWVLALGLRKPAGAISRA